jgi:hypothetical protein
VIGLKLLFSDLRLWVVMSFRVAYQGEYLDHIQLLTEDHLQWSYLETPLVSWPVTFGAMFNFAHLYTRQYLSSWPCSGAFFTCLSMQVAPSDPEINVPCRILTASPTIIPKTVSFAYRLWTSRPGILEIPPDRPHSVLGPLCNFWFSGRNFCKNSFFTWNSVNTSFILKGIYISWYYENRCLIWRVLSPRI